MVTVRWLLLFLIFLPLILATPESAPGADQIEDTDKAHRSHLKEMMAAWKKRQNQVRTLRAKWTETIANEGEGLEQQVISLLMGDTQQMRLETRPPAQQNENEALLPGRKTPMISAFNGSKNFQFTGPLGPDDWPRGIVWSEKKYDEIHNSQIRPWLLHFRPFSTAVPNLSADRLKVVRLDSLAGGRKCTMVETLPQKDFPLTGIYWVDPKRNFSIVRYVEKIRGIPAFELNIEYQPDPIVGWVPSAWNAALANERFATLDRILRYEINPKFTEADFKIEFPEGTIVFDRDLGYRYLLLSNGKKRKITPEESVNGFQYKELITTKPEK